MKAASAFAIPGQAVIGRHGPVTVTGWSGQPGNHAAAGEPGLPRLLRDDPAGPDLSAHDRTFGPASFRSAALISQAGAAGLTGRGGACFPVARKLAAVAAARRGPRTLPHRPQSQPPHTQD